MNDQLPRILAGLALLGVVGLLFAHISLRSDVARLQGQLEVLAPKREVIQSPAVPPPAPKPKAVADGSAEPTAKSTEAKWVCEGVLDADHVGQRLGAQAGPVLACIKAATDEKPEIKGRLQVLVRVGADGKAQETNVSGLAHTVLRTCVGNEALKWTFDPPKGGGCAVVAAPFKVGP